MKKTRRIFNRSVRRTVGALFLASSVVVAAIPTTSYRGGTTSAESFTDAPDYAMRYVLGEDPVVDGGGGTRYTAAKELLTSTQSSVPFIKDSATRSYSDDITNVTVYTSEDSLYQFAYVSMDGIQTEDGNEKYAFILKYNTPGSLPGGNLTIPDAVDAYLAYNTNDGSNTAANVAVGKAGNYLFYKEIEYVTRYDVSGNVVEPPDEIAHYYPCYASNTEDWINRSNDELYWYDTPDFRPDTTKADPDEDVRMVGTDQAHQRITNAPVRYIANQYIEVGADSKQHIKPITQPSQGVFFGNGNITTLTTGGNLSGIGNYAFYNCTGLSTFSFSNGLSAIGNHAFEYCSSLRSIDIPSNTNLQVVGAYAFKNCTSLESFTVPTSVVMLCDGVFQNCINMVSCDLCSGNPASSALRYLGNGVFFNCQVLEELEFPAMYTEEDVNISNFLQCYSLTKFTTNNTSMDFIDDDEEVSGGYDNVSYTFESFRDNVSPNFYMVGVETGSGSQETPEAKWGRVHVTCKEEQIAYNYRGTDYYEKTVTEEGGGTATYLVNGNNNLENCNIVGTVYTLTFPEYIGPNYIRDIGDNAFTDICTLTMVTIPSTIESIGRGAFKGCHNLQYVYFENDNVSIGEDAFKTQDTTVHSGGCATRTVDIAGRTFNIYSSSDMTVNNKPAVQLYFIGTIDSDATPYSYAMSYNGRFNNSSQSPSFAKFLSGYPTCQEIEFVLDSPTAQTGKATLVDFPVLSDTQYLSSATNTKTSYLTTAQKAAIASARSDYGNGIATEDQIAFINATTNLVVPYGVDAIENGLFYRKTFQSSDAMGVTLYGIDTVEADYSSARAATATDDNGDECPPVVTLGTTTIEFEQYTTGGVTSATMSNVPDSDFAGCPNLTNLVLYGNNTKTLEDGAFYGCTGLRSFESYCPVDRIGQEAFGSDTDLLSFQTYNTVGTIADHCCTGDTALNTVALNGDVSSIEKHAFEDCTSLNSVSIDDSLSFLGVAPFRGCDVLSNVEFNGNPRYTCDASIIYSTDASGNKVTLIECLEGRSAKYVNSTETAGIKEISTEAFAECGNILEVDLTKSLIGEIPTDCFEDTTSLRNVKLPYTVDTIEDYAFDGSAVEYIEGTQYLNIIDVNAFDHMTSTGWDPVSKTGDHADNSQVTVCAPEDCYFYKYADRNGYTVTSAPVVEYFEVKFFDYSSASPNAYSQIGETQSILSGDDAVPPTPYGKPGYLFKEWSPAYTDISADTSCYAIYEAEPDDYNKYTVTFYFDQNYTTLLKTVYVSSGQSAANDAPLNEVLNRLGSDEYFNGWIGGDINNITADTRFYANISDVPSNSWKVNYYSYDGSTLLFTTTVKNGTAAPSYQAPKIDGFEFTGWSGDLSNITKETVTVAQYKAIGSSNGSDGSGGNNPGNVPNNGGSGNNNNSGNGSNSGSTNAAYYTLTVVNGSGSGSYIAGSNVIIVANDPGANKAFGSWSISPANTPIASKVLSATMITMPSQNVTVTANYVAAANNGANGTGSGTNYNNNTRNNTNYWPSTGNVPRSSGTTVVIDKNGLSNTGVVSATVNGSTDNFTIRITESGTANKLILDALVKKYGNLDNIIYFPFDISLYDAAGTTQITDVSGLTITITIPLPDSMIQYSANNKVACITNGELDGLNARFTTINSVPCVTFTCTHFSPYVIYVNTVAMAAGSDGSGIGTGGLDNTPKTADPIHPKWFVSIALFAISIVLFLIRDRRTLATVNAGTGNVRNMQPVNNRSNVNRPGNPRRNFNDPDNRPGSKR